MLKLKAGLVFTAGLGALAISQCAGAQEPPQPTQAVDPNEIIVTAQHREQRQSDVGISMAVQSGDNLRALGVTSSADIAKFTPGVFLTGAVGGQSLQYTVRAVSQSDFNDAIESPIATYLDGVYMPVAQGASMAIFDIDRVEILKGPQGTLFGRNATGGLVHTVIAEPKIGSFEGFVNGSYGLYNEAKLEGAINAPLGTAAAVRLSGFWHHRDNFWRNNYPNNIAPGIKYDEFGSPGITYGPKGGDTGKVDEWGARFQVKWEPTDDLTIRLAVSGAETKAVTPASIEVPTSVVFNDAGQIIDIVPTAPDDTRLAIGPGGANYTNLANLGFAGVSPSAGGTRPVPGGNWWGQLRDDAEGLRFSQAFVRPNNKTTSFNAALHLDYDLGGVDLTSISSYQRYTKDLMNTVDGSPVNFLTYGTLARYNVFTQEVRLAGNSDRLTWQVGAFYLNNDAWNVQDIKGQRGSLWASVFGAADTGIDLDERAILKTSSFSMFGQTEWRFAPQLTLVIGGRVIFEHQNYDYDQFAAANCGDFTICYKDVLGGGFAGLQSSFDDRRTQKLWAGKVQLEYRPLNGLMIFAGVNRGTKAGSYNSKLTDGSPPYPADSVPYKAETLYNYEGGFKYADRLVAAEISGFYYDYKDYQAFLFTNLNGIVSNVPAKIYGVDFNGAVSITPSLRIAAGGVILKATLPDYSVIPGIVKDVDMPYAPRKTLTGSITYTLPVQVAGGDVKATGQVSYASGYFVNAKNYTASRMPSRTIADFNIGWVNQDTGMSLSFYLKNAFDERYPLISYDNTMINGSIQQSYADPRTYGVNVGFKF